MSMRAHPITLVLVLAAAGCGGGSARRGDADASDTATETAEDRTDLDDPSGDALDDPDAIPDTTAETDAVADPPPDPGEDPHDTTEEDPAHEEDAGPDFVPIDCPTTPPDPIGHRLCLEAADPEAAPDKVFITCEVETACFGPSDPAPVDELVVLAWNIERGLEMDAQLEVLQDGTLPAADVLLVSEADRGCTRTDHRHVMWEYAEALGMNMVYGVEFTELPRPGGAIETACEHGNAVLSRFPIGNVQIVRHAVNKSWYDVADEPRLGGRVAVVADIRVGDAMLQVHSLHFESGAADGGIREAQAIELADLGLASPHPVVIGGDTNAGTYFLDLSVGSSTCLTTNAFFDRGYLDTHDGMPVWDRITHSPMLVLDIIFTSGPFSSDPGICPLGGDCAGLGDHAPVWATVSLD